MLRVLFCISCCGAPPTNRAGRAAGKPQRRSSGGARPEDDDKLSLTQEEADFQGLLALGKGEKDQLLANQIQANNLKKEYGSKGAIGRLLPGVVAQPSVVVGTGNNNHQNDQLDRLREDSATASTSASNFQLSKPSNSKQQKQAQESVQLQADLPAGLELGFDSSGRQLIDQNESELNYYEVQSVSPPSSIDVEQYKEVPRTGSQVLQVPGDDDAADNVDVATVISEAAAIASIERSYSAGSLDTSVNIPSTTKIGDYARLEYSPVEDLESVKTMSPSRGGSLQSSIKNRSQSWVTRTSSSSQQASPVNKRSSQAGGLSRGSSRGIESTSISITSQLSNEQLQQNLTNMLESANSPITMFGTIGLPLGPPLDNGTLMTETAKTSPETTGAALTSASQDSLSGGSLGSPKAVRKVLSKVNAQEQGAALVGDSVELDAPTQIANSLVSGSSIGTLDRASTIEPPPGERVGSPASMVTTTSGGLTNPTPTPSELSAGSQKKKSRLRPRALLRRLKPGSKKKNKDESSGGN